MKFKLESDGIFFRRGDEVVCWSGGNPTLCTICKEPTNYGVVCRDKIVFGLAICSDECLTQLKERDVEKKYKRFSWFSDWAGKLSIPVWALIVGAVVVGFLALSWLGVF